MLDWYHVYLFHKCFDFSWKSYIEMNNIYTPRETTETEFSLKKIIQIKINIIWVWMYDYIT